MSMLQVIRLLAVKGDDMTPDISNMTATELDDLISDALKQRAKIQPGHPMHPPQSTNAIADPAWFTSLIQEHRQLFNLSIRHPGAGWLSFAIPLREVANLMKFWSDMLATVALDQDQHTQEPPPAPPTFSGGGCLH